MEDEGCDIKVYETDLTGSYTGLTKVYNLSLGIYWKKTIDTYTGSIEQARIYLDSYPGGLLEQDTDWQNKTIVHEFGHAVGLAHPDCGSDAIMQ